MAEGCYFSRKAGARCRKQLLEPVQQPQLVKIDPVVGIFDIGVGQMLIAVAQVVSTADAEAAAKAEMFSKLECTAEAFIPELGRRKPVRANAALKVRPAEAVGLEPEHRCQSDFRQA